MKTRAHSLSVVDPSLGVACLLNWPGQIQEPEKENLYFMAGGTLFLKSLLLVLLGVSQETCSPDCPSSPFIHLSNTDLLMVCNVPSTAWYR